MDICCGSDTGVEASHDNGLHGVFWHQCLALMDAAVKLRDPDIREPLLKQLGLWVTEFTVDGARADVVDVTDSELVFYEIKSDLDTNVRLAGQVQAYDKVATKLYLVTTPRQLKKMEGIIPPWWGIILATWTDKGVTLTEHQDARPNPAWKPLEALTLLWTPEIDQVTEKCGIPQREGKSKALRAKCILSAVGVDKARTLWLSQLRKRYTDHPEIRGPGKTFVHNP